MSIEIQNLCDLLQKERDNLNRIRKQVTELRNDADRRAESAMNYPSQGQNFAVYGGMAGAYDKVLELLKDGESDGE